MIVFGHNSFLLNECKPSQLGMSPDLDAVYTVERRQRYFHLFWIPTFGIGKIWALRKKSDNNLYVPNAELENALNSLKFIDKTPWYTYALPILIVVGGALFYVSQTVGDYQRQRRNEQSRLEKNQGLVKAINAPMAFHYYDMRPVSGSSDHVYLKVLNANQQTVTCLLSKKQDQSYSEYRALEAFVTDALNKSFDTVRINKADLLKTINEKDTYPFEGKEIVAGVGNLELSELKVFDFPVFKSIQSEFNEGAFSAIIQNIGEEATVHAMKTESSNMTFDGDVIPKKIKAGDLIEIKGTYTDVEPKMRSTVKFVNQMKDTAKYNFSIYSSYLTLKKSDR